MTGRDGLEEKLVYLILPSTYRQVTDGPGCFFLGAEVTLKFKRSMHIFQIACYNHDS